MVVSRDQLPRRRNGADAPLGFAAGDANLYRYVGNNPLNASDPSGLAKVEIPPAPWDVDLFKVIDETIKEMQGQNWKAKLKPNGTVNDPGEFGKELERRVFAKLRKVHEKSRQSWASWAFDNCTTPGILRKLASTGHRVWFTDLTIDKDTLVVKSVDAVDDVQDTKQNIQVDLVRVKPGYTPEVGKPLDLSQVDDIYELKANRDGVVDADQVKKLKNLLNCNQPHQPRQFKRIHTPKRQDGSGRLVDNPKFSEAFKLFSSAVAVLGISSSVMAMVQYDQYDGDLQDAIMAFEKAKSEKDPLQATVARNHAIDKLITYISHFTEGTGLNSDLLKAALIYWNLSK